MLLFGKLVWFFETIMGNGSTVTAWQQGILQLFPLFPTLLHVLELHRTMQRVSAKASDN